MDPKELIAFLWRTGHFWNPETPNAHNVTAADLHTLTLADKVVQAAVRSFQLADGNLATLAFAKHGRAPIEDGDVGPATELLAQTPRCPLPDHRPPKGVAFAFADPDMQAVVESMQAHDEATGSGSWPASGCDPQRQGMHSIRITMDTSKAPAKVKGYLVEALAFSVKAFAEIGVSVRYILDAGHDGEIIKRWESLQGSVIGWNEFPRGGCTKIQGRLDSTFAPDMQTFANLEVHETGHGVGLEHTRGSIMNPSLNLVWPLSWKGTPSHSALVRYFGGQPVPPNFGL